MKSIALAAIALSAAFAGAAANAATGAPALSETGGHPFSQSAPVDMDSGVGSYARYLMLNGMPREEALKVAQNIDNPAPTRFALFHHNAKSTSATGAATTQQ